MAGGIFAQETPSTGPTNSQSGSTREAIIAAMKAAGIDPATVGAGAGATNVGASAYQATKSASSSGDPEVLRAHQTWDIPKAYNDRGDLTLRAGYQREDKTVYKPAALDDYSGEYWTKVNDDKFQLWMRQRASIFGVDLLDKDGRFDYLKGAQVWAQFGSIVASNAQLRSTMTPEQWADMQYQKVGGDNAFAAYQEALAAESAAAQRNPITTTTETAYTTMNKGAAEAQVDQLARALLGHLATEKQLAHYRGVINSFLRANPSVRTTTTDATDPDNVKVTSKTKDGASAQDAVNMLEMKLRRGSEGMAFNAGKMIEDALAMMDRGL